MKKPSANIDVKNSKGVNNNNNNNNKKKKKKKKKEKKKKKKKKKVRELKKPGNMKVTVTPIVIGELGTTKKRFDKGLEELVIRSRVDPPHTN